MKHPTDVINGLPIWDRDDLKTFAFYQEGKKEVKGRWVIADTEQRRASIKADGAIEDIHV